MSRILLLLDHKENRRLLSGQLAGHHELVSPEDNDPLEEPADLCIVDGPALLRLRDRLRQRKCRELPVFLPVLLVTPRHRVGVVTQQLWECVDELIITPVERRELEARLEILLRMRRLSRENALLLARLQAEMADASEIQANLLPTALPNPKGFEIAARCIPARGVGGDFYDWQQMADGRFSFTVADAMGKGMPGSLLMATVRAGLRSVAPRHGPAAALDLVRSALEADLVRTSSFVTIFHAALEANTLRYVDAGHGHVFFSRSNGEAELLLHGGPALGLPFSGEFREGESEFGVGDALVVYSDGLLECQPDGLLTPETLNALVAGSRNAREMLSRLLALVPPDEPLSDDLTVFILRSAPR